jgi:hypothetical protein
MCKTMERMTNARLVWFLESNGLLFNVQCEFRQGRNTLDHLVRFETFIWNAFAKKEHDVSIFFDLQKVYDTTWKYGILKDLFDMGLKGKLPTFMSNFLSNIEFNSEFIQLILTFRNMRWDLSREAYSLLHYLVLR